MVDVVPASLPAPPYYAVVFTSLRTAGDNGYGKRADEMLKLVADQPGFLGVDSARGADGLGITVAYFTNEESIASWRNQPAHAVTRADGRELWYESFAVHVAKVERAYSFNRSADR
jgi:heme-degrading monooxygenase HmoA